MHTTTARQTLVIMVSTFAGLAVPFSQLFGPGVDRTGGRAADHDSPFLPGHPAPVDPGSRYPEVSR